MARFWAKPLPRLLPRSMPKSRIVPMRHLLPLPLAPTIAVNLLGGISSEWIYKATGNKRLSRQGIAVAGMIICSMLNQQTIWPVKFLKIHQRWALPR